MCKAVAVLTRNWAYFLHFHSKMLLSGCCVSASQVQDPVHTELRSGDDQNWRDVWQKGSIIFSHVQLNQTWALLHACALCVPSVCKELCMQLEVSGKQSKSDHLFFSVLTVWGFCPPLISWYTLICQSFLSKAKEEWWLSLRLPPRGQAVDFFFFFWSLLLGARWSRHLEGASKGLLVLLPAQSKTTVGEVARGLFQLRAEYLQGWRFYNLSEHLWNCWKFHRKNLFGVAACVLSPCISESVSAFSTTCNQVAAAAAFLLQAAQAQLSQPFFAYTLFSSHCSSW